MFIESTLRLRSLRFDSVRTYIAASIFVAGNIVFPQLLHLVPQGGLTWLPIYFFTLIGAWLCGWRVGVLTALASPVINSLLFGMPPVAMLPAIMIKSTLLAIFASAAARRFMRADLFLLFGVVLAYQIVGTLAEWVIKADFMAACQDFRIGIPGMLLQIFGGWLLINYLARRD